MPTMFPNSGALLWVTVLGVTLWLSWPFIRRLLQWCTIVNSIPGPSVMQTSKFYWRLIFAQNPKEINEIFRSAIDPLSKFPVVRCWLGPLPVLTVYTAEAAKVLLNSNTQIEKAFVYRYIRDWLGDGLVVSNGNKWHQRRRLIAPAFNFKLLEDFLLVMNEQADVLIEILDKKCEEMKGKGLDIYPFITRCSLDIICETAMGQSVNAQLIEDSDYITAVGRFSHLILQRSMKPWLYFDCIYRLTSLGKLQEQSISIANDFTNNVIKMKRKKLIETKRSNIYTSVDGPDDVMGRKCRLAFLDLLLEKSMDINGNGGQPLTDEDIREEVQTFMFTGHETSSTSIALVLYHIGLRPQIQTKVMDELIRIYGDSGHHSTSSDLNNLKYLECIIKETLRLNPITPVVARELTDDIEMCGYTIPAGTTVAIMLFYIQRDSAKYPAPETFDPDRFLPENSQDRDHHAFIPFSAGPRNCIGQKFAMMEIKVVVAAILRRFKVTVLEQDLMSDLIYNINPKQSCGRLVQLEPRRNLSD